MTLTMTPTALHTWRARCGFPTWEAAGVALGISGTDLERWASGSEPAPLWLTRAAGRTETAQARAELAEGIRALRATAEEFDLWGYPDVRESIEAAERALQVPQ